MADEERDLAELNAIYDELLGDARRIVVDLGESVSLYFILGVYLLVFSLGVDLYAAFSHEMEVSGYASLLVLLIFGNLIPIAVGSFLVYRYYKLNARYSGLFRLEKSIRLKEFYKRYPQYRKNKD